MKSKITSFFTRKETANKYFFFSKFSSARIAFLGMYLAILVTLKYVLGFVVGIELVTFMFIMAGLFLPLIDGVFLVIAFNLIVMAMYGVGTWEVMYWIIWPLDFLGTKLLSKFTRNKMVIGLWGFICGLSLLWWYFLSDMFFFGSEYAIANIITAIPVNLIEGFTTVTMIFLTGNAISKLFGNYSLYFWNKEKPFSFRVFKHNRFWLILTMILIVGMVVGIVLLFVYNDWFIALKQNLFPVSPATYI